MTDPVHSEPSNHRPPPDVPLREPSQYVTVRIDKELYAFPMAAVREIIRLPEFVRVPLAPSFVEGVANLRNQVLPVVNLRRKLDLPDAEPTLASRVIVVDVGEPIGFVVDGVERVTNFDAGAIGDIERLHGRIDSELLVGTLQTEYGIVLLLDVERLTRRETVAGGAERIASRGPSNRTAVCEESGSERHLVRFGVAGEEYAFDIDNVREIVHRPNDLTRLPNTPAHVLGVMSLRSRLVPLVSLREMFGFGEPSSEVPQRVLLTSVGEKEEDIVGVVTDSVSEVLRLPTSRVEDVPAFLRSSRRGREIEGLFRTEVGNRVVSILSVGELLGHPAMIEALSVRESLRPPITERPQPLLENVMTAKDAMRTETDSGSEGHLVVFQLASAEYALGIENVQEIIRIPDSITRVPNSHPALAGVANVRGAVLPIVNFRHRFGLPTIPREERHRVLILRIGDESIGFVVDSVTQVLKSTNSDFDSLPDAAREEDRAIQGVLNLPEQKRMVLVLQPSALFDAKELSALSSARGSAAA